MDLFKESQKIQKNKKFLQMNFRVSENEKEKIEQFCKYYNLDYTSWFNLMINDTYNSMILDKTSK